MDINNQTETHLIIINSEWDNVTELFPNDSKSDEIKKQFSDSIKEIRMHYQNNRIGDALTVVNELYTMAGMGTEVCCGNLGLRYFPLRNALGNFKKYTEQLI